MEKAEHEREVALRDELIRQEKLERLAQRFDHKAAMRETWLNENQRLVSQVGGAGGLGGGGRGWGGCGVGLRRCRGDSCWGRLGGVMLRCRGVRVQQVWGEVGRKDPVMLGEGWGAVCGAATPMPWCSQSYRATP